LKEISEDQYWANLPKQLTEYGAAGDVLNESHAGINLAGFL
jgi:hypothetical protein